MKSKTMTKGRIEIIFVILLVAAICVPLAAFAVSYPAQLYHREERHDKFVKGDTLYMFHSGTEEVKKTFRVDSILSAYRISATCEVQETGKIRILSHVAETYMKGEVVEGEIKADDIVKKGKVSCIVISAGICEN